MGKHVVAETKLTGEEAYTIGSYLRSAASKFEEIAADCEKPESSPAYKSLASTFKHQSQDAVRLAEIFERAAIVTVTEEDE